MAVLRGAFDRLVYGALRGAMAAMLALPPRVAESLARRVARLYLRLDRGRAATVRENLRVAFGDGLDEAERERLLVATFEHAFRVAFEVVWRPRLLPHRAAYRRAVRVVGDEDEMRSELRARRGGLVLTAHLGNWELAGAYLRVEGVPTSVVARALDNPHVDRWLADERGGGEVVIDKRGAVRAILDAVRRGRWVGILADQNAGKNGVFVPFFGLAASTYRTPAALAVRHGLPVYFASALRRGSGFAYDVLLRRYRPPADGSHEERERHLLESYSAQVEEWTRDAPEQYLWLHRRWRTRPAGEPKGPRVPAYGRPVVPPRASAEAAAARSPPAGR